MENHNGVTTRCSGYRTPLLRAVQHLPGSFRDRVTGTGITAGQGIGDGPEHPRVGVPPERRGRPPTGRAPQCPGEGPPGSEHRLRWALLSAAVTCTVIAWGLLVFAAIDFGGKARDGEPGNWWFLALATIGAMACMFLAILLASRLQSEIRGQGPPTAAAADRVQRWQARRQARRSLTRPIARRGVVSRSRFGP